MSASTRSGKQKNLETVRKEEKQDLPLQGLGKEDDSAPGPPVGQHITPPCTTNVENESTTVSPAPGSVTNRRISAEDTSLAGKSTEGRGSRRKSTRTSVNGPATSGNQDSTTKAGFEPIQIDRTSPSHAKAIFPSNGFTDDQQSSLGRNGDLGEIPSDLHHLGIWVAQSIGKHSDKRALLAVSEPRQKEPSPQTGQDIETSDALDKVENGRMTRGKEKKRLQQLKGKEPTNDSSSKIVAGAEEPLQPRDAARIGRRLKDDLNDELKQKLFGSSVVTDVSTNVIERNACGKILFNTLVDMGDSVNRNSAAVLKSALEERQDDAPFLSALKILASSSKIMAFINFFINKDNTPLGEASNDDESRPSTVVKSSGATTITGTSGLTSRAGTSVSEAEGLPKATTKNKAVDHKEAEKQKRSQKVTQALEAATTVLLQIQQGEAGTGYVTSYTSGSMIPNPTGQQHMPNHGTVFGPPHSDYHAYGMMHAPPIGANLNNYASPYFNPVATHPSSYASPYSNPVNRPPASYASPYANPVVLNQTSGSGLVASVGNQASKHGGSEAHHEDEKALTPRQHNMEVPNQDYKVNDAAAGQDISNEGDDASGAGKEADDQGISNEKEETSKPCDEATGQGVSNQMEKTSRAGDSDETEFELPNKQGSSSKEDNETSSDDDLTDDDLTDEDLVTAKVDNQNITPPAENHRLFTGERLGDFSTTENIDWLLTIGNGGKIPRSSKKTRMESPSESSSSPVDNMIQTKVSMIIDQIMLCKDLRGYGTPRQLFYASAEGQRLAAELRRLMTIAKPVVNAIMPRAESQARLRFYQQLESRARVEERDRAFQANINRYYGPPFHMQQWVPPPGGFPAVSLPIPPPLPSNGPMQAPFVRRGNVIAAPPGGRNIEEEKKAETYGYPPTPGSRPGGSQRGQKRKAQH